MYEVQDDGSTQTTKKYYSIAGMRVAMDDGIDLVYFASDHLSSTSIVMDASGTLLSEQRYLPFGGVRYENDMPHPRIVKQPTRYCNMFEVILL